MKNNSKHLRIAGFLEILLGAGSILAIRYLLGAEGQVELSETAAKTALLGLTGLYAMNGFKILAGLLGICLAGKRSLLTVLLGVVLFFVQLVSFIQLKGGIPVILFNAVLLAIPYYYMHNAYKVYRSGKNK